MVMSQTVASRARKGLDTRRSRPIATRHVKNASYDIFGFDAGRLQCPHDGIRHVRHRCQRRIGRVFGRFSVIDIATTTTTRAQNRAIQRGDERDGLGVSAIYGQNALHTQVLQTSLIDPISLGWTL